MTRRRWLTISLGLVAQVSSPASSAEPRTLVDPVTILKTAERMDFVSRNDFSVERTPAGPAVRSTPRKSASGLYMKMDIDGRTLTDVRWTWRVDSIQRSADLRDLAVEDSAATVFFIFGEPSFFNRDVPTLAYVWSGTPVATGAVLKSARYATLRYINLQGADAVGNWKLEARDVAQDFRTIFHRQPDALRYIALFNDNDQTGEPCSALFGPIVAAESK